ncbi:MAG: hypothetical protein ACYC6C_05600 [Coriobacteriia bacterium]
MSKAADAIKKIANQNDVKQYLCYVESINGSTCDCVPVNGEAPLKQVRLNVNINSDNGILITPKTGNIEQTEKFVLVSALNSIDSWVSMFSEIESISIKIGNTTLLIKDGEIKMNGGENNGLVKITELIQKLNNLENDINTLKSAFSTWIVVPNDGGAALKAVSATWSTSTIVTTQQSDLEDTKVKH